MRTVATTTGVGSYCKPCHNLRGKRAVEKVGGSRTYHLSRRYGITAAEVDHMLRQQSGLRAICRRAAAGHVDHDHRTGAVRALLCFNCNGGLGQFKDDPAVLRAAAEYVERHRKQQRPQSMSTRRLEVRASVGSRRSTARRWPELRRQVFCSPIERRLADFLTGR